MKRRLKSILMPELQSLQRVGDVEFKVIYSIRRSLGISVLPDSSVIVRAPYRTSRKLILRIVEEKSAWIIKHRDNFLNQYQKKPVRSFITGSSHQFRGNEFILNIRESRKPFIRFNGSSIEAGTLQTSNEESIRKLLQKAYKNEAIKLFPNMFYNILEKHNKYGFKPAGLVIRTMKRRWGSCSNIGRITLSSELIRLNDKYIEYVILHELCHLRHHNHGPKFYELLSELYPDWEKVRKEIKDIIR